MTLAITKPTIGGSEDTWGATINTALDTIVTEVNNNANGTNAINLAEGSWTIGGAAVTASAASINTASTHYVPTGGIIMWSGSIASIPSGWALCDGGNGTPNLQDRFVVGAGSSYGVGDTGGAASVSLSESELPSHTHGVGTLGGSTNTAGAHTHTIATGLDSAQPTLRVGTGRRDAVDYTGTTSSAGDHSHTISLTGSTAATGSGSAHENRPPYYALAYIMKL